MPTFIHVQISLQKELRPCPVPAIRFVENDPTNPHIITLSPWPYVDPEIRVSTGSNLSYLSGTVNFSSPCPLALQSIFLVYLDDSDAPLHSEITPLKCLSSPTKESESGWLYNSGIAPDFWDSLCSSPGKFWFFHILQFLWSMRLHRFKAIYHSSISEANSCSSLRW